MRRWLTTLSIIICCFATVKGQNGLGLYTLGDAVPQNSRLNPANEIKGKLVLGLPVISEMGLHVNNRFGYNQAFTKLENDSVKLDVDKVVSHLKKRNALLFETSIPLLYVGIKPEKSSFGYSFFVNERINVRGQYTKNLIKAAWEGTNSLVGQPLDIGKSAFSASYFREYGVGVNTSLMNDDLKIGARVKLIQGIYNVKTLWGMDARVDIEPETYSYGFLFKRAGLNAAGVSEDPSVGYLLSNPNKGAAIDLGATWTHQNLFSLSASITDLGYVRWKEFSQNFILSDTSFAFQGVNFTADGDIESTIDSLKNAFTPKETANPYSAMLSAKSIVSGSLLLGPVDRVTVTMMNQLLVGKIKTAFAVSYVKQLTPGIVASGSVVKLPQQWPRPGLALSMTGGPVQYYIASDNLIGFANVGNMNTLDFKMGVNLIIGSGKAKNETDLPPAHRSKPKFSSNDEGVDYPTDPRLKKPTVIRKKDIYTIITKKKQPKSWKNWFKKKKEDN